MCSEISYFGKIRPLTKTISLGGASQIHSIGIGPVDIIANGKKETIQNCLLIPKLKINLISATRLLQKKYFISLNKTNAFVSYQSELLFSAKMENYLFVLPFTKPMVFANNAMPITSDIWH
jgi:hypothetical protein